MTSKNRLLYSTNEEPIYGKDFILHNNYIVHIRRINVEGCYFGIKSYKFSQSQNIIELLDSNARPIHFESSLVSLFFIDINSSDDKMLSLFQSGFSKTSWNTVIKDVEEQLQKQQQQERQH